MLTGFASLSFLINSGEIRAVQMTKGVREIPPVKVDRISALRAQFDFRDDFRCGTRTALGLVRSPDDVQIEMAEMIREFQSCD